MSLKLDIGLGIKSQPGGLVVPPILSDGTNEQWLDYLTTVTANVGNEVLNFGDKTVHGRDVLDVGGGKPILTADGVLANGINDLLKSAPYAVPQPFTIYAVFRQITWTNGDKLFDGNSTNNVLLWQGGGSPNLQAYAGTISAANGDAPLTTFVVAQIVYDGANSRFYIDDNAPILWNCGAKNIDGCTLFRSGAAGSAYGNYELKCRLTRSLAELDANRIDIRNYFNAYYGL